MSNSQGSLDFLDNGNIFVDYGAFPILKEFGSTDISSEGDVRWTAAFGPYTNNAGVVQSYRGYKNEWHGTPSEGPSLFVEKAAAGCRTAYVSWNGATDVSHWLVFWGSHSDIHVVGYMGQEVSSIDTFVGKVAYMGFETAFTVAGPCVQVAAVTTDGITHIRSDVICMINIRNV